MQYLFLIYADEKKEAQPSTPRFDKIMNGYMAFTEDVQKKGICASSNALTPVSTATTVRVRDGQTQTTDGPFAETKEQLGGYYLLECKDLDEAIEYASRIPSAEYGSIEIRPIMTFD